jgi:hypothetical protein
MCDCNELKIEWCWKEINLIEGQNVGMHKPLFFDIKFALTLAAEKRTAYYQIGVVLDR